VGAVTAFDTNLVRVISWPSWTHRAEAEAFVPVWQVWFKRVAMGAYNPPVVFTRLPAFTLAGLLPPYCGSDPTERQYLAPYPTRVDVVAQQMGGTPARSQILRGFLAFRQALNQVGLCDGFQWLDGSFAELIELRERRDPRDLDVVTFFRRPPQVRSDVDWQAFFNANRGLFDPVANKRKFHCDTYFVDLDLDPMNIVAQARYWYGLFSHRRVTGEWKGMLEVPLQVTTADAAAEALLAPGGAR
jgi:hypothetical protein